MELNLDELEGDAGIDRRTTKERLKEERALAALKRNEEIKAWKSSEIVFRHMKDLHGCRRFNLRKENYDQEVKYEASCRDLVKSIFDKLGYEAKWPLVQADSRHQRGTFDLLVDLSDRRIRLLEDALRGRDLRLDLLKTIHIEVIHNILKKHQKNIDTLTEDFLQAKEKMMAERKTFLQNTLIKGKQLRDEIRLASYASDKGELIQEIIQKYEGELGDFNEMCTRRFEEFYNDYEKTILDKWIVYKNVFESYKEESEDLRRKIYIAKERDDKDNREIAKLKRQRVKFEEGLEATKKLISPKMERDLKSVEELRDCIQAYERLTWLSKDLELEAGTLEGSLKILQRLQNRGLAEDQSCLDHLNRTTDRVMRELRSTKQLAEKVVRMRRGCQRLETENEVLAPDDWIPEEARRLLGEDVFLKSSSGGLALDFQTSKVEAGLVFMSAKLAELRTEEGELKRKLRQAIELLATLDQKRDLASGLHSIENMD